MPWARPDRGFTPWYIQAAMSLVREMPALAVSRQLEVTDKRLWRIMHQYVGRMQGNLDLSQVANVGIEKIVLRRYVMRDA